ncbi:MAG: helicase HerA-like domain-containing protein [Acidobacteriota bacterium]
MKAELLIGGAVSGVAGEAVRIDRDVLTTHGVILGMTGSGKTGLAVVMLEELARARVPLLICDLKGDMTNLLLTFPRLAPDDFAPYLPASEAAGDRAAAAAAVAGRWREGLGEWSLAEAEIRQVRENLRWQLLTPGSGLAPVDLLPALEAPTGYDPDLDPDGARTRLDGTAAGLLALVGRGGDPLSDREHVLLATLLDTAWRAGRPLDLASLIGQIADPPVERFGVLDAESFFPRKERQELVLAFNTVLASPSFGVWTRGTPLAIEALIGDAAAPRASILYLAHLADRERLSFLTLLFSALLAWTRSQPGSDSLRVLLYLDEVQGILPPSAMPPTKPPLLTLLKQGRAFGTGVLLATQNPVDLDYKALGNVGLKLVGRLDTENDRNRALEGLDVADASADATVAGLKQRQFLLAGARMASPRVITSRWAMSYLRGPLTLAELRPLVGPQAAAPAAPTAAHQAPPLLPGVEQLFAGGGELQPHVLLDAEVVYRKSSPAIERRVAGRWLAPFEGERIAWERLYQPAPLALASQPAAGVRLAGLPGRVTAVLEAAPRQFAGEIDSRALEVLWHRELRLVQEDGEDREGFEARCRQVAPDGTGKGAQLRRAFDEKLRRIDERLQRERLELERDEQEATARSREKTLAVATGVGEAILGALFGGRRRGLGSLARRGASTARTYSTKDRMADRAEAQVEESRQTIASIEEERRQLEAERDGELMRVNRLSGGEAEVEALRLTPAAKDITVRRVVLAWLGGELQP